MNVDENETGSTNGCPASTTFSAQPNVLPSLRAAKLAAAKAPPKLCRHRSSGRAYVTVAGKQHYLGTWGSPETKAAYARFLLEVQASGGSRAVRSSALTVRGLCDAYETHARAYYVKGHKPTPEVCAIASALGPVRELYGSMPATEFGPLALKAVREKLIAKGWVRRTVNSGVGRIRRAFQWGTENELVPGETWHALQAVAGLKAGRTSAPDGPPIRPVAESVVEATIAHLPAVLAVAVRVQLLTGMRPGEVLSMRVGDIDRSGMVWLYEPRLHKNTHRGQGRQVAIGPRAQEAIAPLLKADPAAYIFSPRDVMRERNAARREARATPLYASHLRAQARKRKRHPRVAPGDCFTADSYRRAIEYTCSRAGIERWHPHQLRHLAATKLRAAYGIEIARVLLGHATIDATEIYAEADRARAVAVAAEVG